MKKQLIFLFIFAMTFFIGNRVINAEDGRDRMYHDASEQMEEGRMMQSDGLLAPEQKRPKMEAQMRERREEIQKENETMRAEAKTKMDAMRDSLKLEKDTVKAKIKEMRITERENVLKKFDAAVTRVNMLKDKINSQIAKLEVKGVATTDAKNYVTTVEEKLTTVGKKITEANALLSVSIDTLTTDSKATLKALAKDIETSLKDAHTALNDAVKSLRDAMKAKMETERNAKLNAENKTEADKSSTTTENKQ